MGEHRFSDSIIWSEVNVITLTTFINSRYRVRLVVLLLWTLVLGSPAAAGIQNAPSDEFMGIVSTLSSLEDRSTGTKGNAAAAAYIKEQFAQLGFDEVGSHRFLVPVLRHGQRLLSLPDHETNLSIQPIKSNAISPEAIAQPGIEGPLIYVGPGELKNFNGKAAEGAIILMEIDSGRNWLNAATLGAKALIYVDRGVTPRTFF
jgi:hypothetical protein